MKNVPNTGGIHLLSGHLHGCEGKERERTTSLLGWQQCRGMTCDSCDSTEGGWAGDLLRPLIQLRHTAPCQTQQLDSSHSEDSIDLLSGGPVALPYNPAPLNTAITPPLTPAIRAAIRSPPNQPPKWLVKSGYGIQVGRER